jgi:hypothetical protein
MKEVVRFLPVETLVKSGIILEVNRQFLHPLGLAIEIDWKTRALRVADFSHDSEGIIYGEEMLDPALSKKFMAVQKIRHARRRRRLGYVVQPFDGGGDESEGDSDAGVPG